MYGNVVTGSTASVTVSPNGGSPTTIAAADGIATFSNLVPSTAGSYTLTATDSADGLQSATPQSVTVNAALSVNVTDTNTVLQNVASGTITLASFNEVGASSNPGSYTATVAWGDQTTSTSTGNNLAVTLSISGDVVTVSGTHTYTTAGLFDPTVTLTYQGASTSTAAPAIVTDVEANVTNQVATSLSPYHYNPFTKVTTTTLTFTNATSTALAGQFSAVLHAA